MNEAVTSAGRSLLDARRPSRRRGPTYRPAATTFSMPNAAIIHSFATTVNRRFWDGYPSTVHPRASEVTVPVWVFISALGGPGQRRPHHSSVAGSSVATSPSTSTVLCCLDGCRAAAIGRGRWCC